MPTKTTQRGSERPATHTSRTTNDRQAMRLNRPFGQLHWGDTRRQSAPHTCPTTPSHRPRGIEAPPSPIERLHAKRSNRTSVHSRRATTRAGRQKTARQQTQQLAARPQAAARWCHQGHHNGKAPKTTLANKKRTNAPMPFRLGAIFSSSFSVKNSAYGTARQEATTQSGK